MESVNGKGAAEERIERRTYAKHNELARTAQNAYSRAVKTNPVCSMTQMDIVSNLC